MFLEDRIEIFYKIFIILLCFYVLGILMVVNVWGC